MAGDPDCAAVEALEIRLLKTEVRKSREELERLLADDFVEIGASGKHWRKADIIESLLSSPGQEIEFDGMTSRLISEDVILLNYRSWRMQPAERNVALRSSIWKRREGEWQVIFHQGTKSGP